MNTVIRLFCCGAVALLAGCASFTSPPNECRVSHFDGQAETGYAVSLEANASGTLEMVRVVQAGTGCKGVRVEFAKDGLINATIEKHE